MLPIAVGSLEPSDPQISAHSLHGHPSVHQLCPGTILASFLLTHHRLQGAVTCRETLPGTGGWQASGLQVLPQLRIDNPEETCKKAITCKGRALTFSVRVWQVYSVTSQGWPVDWDPHRPALRDLAGLRNAASLGPSLPSSPLSTCALAVSVSSVRKVLEVP